MIMGTKIGIESLLERLSAGRCIVCSRSSSGALCPGCLPRPPEGSFVNQLRSQLPQLVDGWAHACLVDCFGQAHQFCVDPSRDARVVIGRDVDCELAIVAPPISRHHAVLHYCAREHGWAFEDLGSRNGTRVDGRPLRSERRSIVSASWLRVATFELLFFAARHVDARIAKLSSTGADLCTISQVEFRRLTFAPADAGGGVVVIDGGGDVCGRVRVSLSALDFELLYLLARRYVEMRNFEAETRGFVASVDLLDEALPFGTDTPTSNNLRGAIKRIRDKLRRCGVEPVIESRQHLGYRLSPVFELIEL